MQDSVVEGRQVEVGLGEARLSISRIMLEKEIAMIAELQSQADEREGEDGDEPREEKRLSISRLILEKEVRRMRRAEGRAGADPTGGIEDVGKLERRELPHLLEVLMEEAAGDEDGLLWAPSRPMFTKL